MKRNNILAHRGCWTQPGQKNGRQALFSALEQGFGLETDLRDLDGDLVISHDPATRDTALPAAELFAFYSRCGASGTLALNIKADGLQRLLADHLAQAGIGLERVFVFDIDRWSGEASMPIPM